MVLTVLDAFGMEKKSTHAQRRIKGIKIAGQELLCYRRYIWL